MSATDVAPSSQAWPAPAVPSREHRGAVFQATGVSQPSDAGVVPSNRPKKSR